MLVLNERTKIAHIRPTMEICNLDQAKQKEFVDSLPEGYRMCKHCAKR